MIRRSMQCFLLFEKISKKELERQRGKGPNHNSTRIVQVEKQIRQYEQQLNEIKRRLESIEVLVCIPISLNFVNFSLFSLVAIIRFISN